ncbi:MAG: TonB-dependent receptor [Rikenellaceae bacterium]
MKHLKTQALFIALLSLCPAIAEDMTDLTADISTVHISSIKQGLSLSKEPIAASVISQSRIESDDIETLKGVSDLVPNLFIPAYGSRITSSIYVRGLGTRIDQPVIGLNIDNVAVINKNGFDLDVMDISRMEILRGPQSSLYGRNTMGGVINIYTISPFNFQGIKAQAEYASGNSYSARLALYHKFSDKLAMAIGGNYSQSDGLFTNTYSGERCDTEQSGGARLKIDYRPSQRTTIENTISLNITDQGGYAYEQLGSGEINYNSPSEYNRTTISEGFTLRHKRDKYTINSITSYQYLDDRMTIDNDFTAEDYFTLTQAIREHAITEDFVLSSNSQTRYSWLFGTFAMYKNQKMSAPVTFKEYSIDNLILKYPNIYFAPYYFDWNEDEFTLNSDFTTQNANLALYHKSSYELSKRLILSAAIRLDYEYISFDYYSTCSTSYSTYSEDGSLYKTTPINAILEGSPSEHYLALLPNLSILYTVGSRRLSSIYGSISKGYKAGGYNTQMFSDILKQEVSSYFGLSATYDADDVIAYEPEWSWNYEIGAKYLSRNNSLKMDAALFYIDCRNQQLTVFPEGQTTGRMMTNAGRSRSFGAELSTEYRKGRFSLNGSYGYTNAKFIEYIDGDNDYSGSRVPYAPESTIYAGAIYRQPLPFSWAKALSFDINTNGAGKIYWDEANSVSQPLYVLLNASVTLEGEGYALSFWGKNITDKEYDTFYFESMDNQFVNPGLMATYGVRLSLNINNK